MQISGTSCTASSNATWTPPKPHFLYSPPLPPPLHLHKISHKPLNFPISLKASFKLSNRSQEDSPARLPVAVRWPGAIFQYLWDNNQLYLVFLDKESSFSLGKLEDGYERFIGVCRLGVRNFFLPRETSENYLEYVKRKLLHRVFSSALHVLATQAMFREIGIGYSHSLLSAAAMNWVLKEGLGRTSTYIHTAILASAFDTNIKVYPLLSIYPIFTAIDLLGIYQGLKHVHLQMLTKVVNRGASDSVA